MNKKYFSHLAADFPASMVVFLVAVPLCLGIALACNVPLSAGIIAGVLGGIVIGFLGGSELGVSGPAAGLVAIVAAAMTDLGTFELLLLSIFIAGVIQVLFGIIKAGTIAYFFPSAVIKGMLAAIGLIIIIKEIPHAVGYDYDYIGDINFQEKAGHNTFNDLKFMLMAINPVAIVITVVSLVILVIWEIPVLKKSSFFKLFPASMVVVILGIVGQNVLMNVSPELALSKDHLVNLSTEGGVTSWLAFPDFSGLTNGVVWKYAVTIALIASIESLLCAEATDKMDPEKRMTPMNKELRAQGIGNMISGLIGGLPITQVIVRSSANIQAGGKTRMSAILHGAMMLVSVLLIPGVLNMIPFASLAAILMVVGFKLVKPAIFKSVWKKGWSQFIPFMVTLVAIVLSDLLVGIIIGVGVSIFFILLSNFNVPYTFNLIKDGEKHNIHIELSEIVSFLNKGNFIKTFQMIPDNSKVTIDASRTIKIDQDVHELILDFKESAKQKGMEVEIIWDTKESFLKPVKELKKAMN